MSGSIEVSFSLRLGSASNLLLYLVLMKAREEKPFSHNYVVANGMTKRTALSESAGYSLRHCIRKSSNVLTLKADFNVSSQDSVFKSSCSKADKFSSRTSEALMRNGSRIQGTANCCRRVQVLSNVVPDLISEPEVIVREKSLQIRELVAYVFSVCV